MHLMSRNERCSLLGDYLLDWWVVMNLHMSLPLHLMNRNERCSLVSPAKSLGRPQRSRLIRLLFASLRLLFVSLPGLVNEHLIRNS